jgi:hypothetical protein
MAALPLPLMQSDWRIEVAPAFVTFYFLHYNEDK